jgi:hypothetical protein
MMIKLLINVIWFDSSIYTCSACLIWEFYFKKKNIPWLTFPCIHRTKAICQYAMLTFYTYATCRYIELYQMLRPY